MFRALIVWKDGSATESYPSYDAKAIYRKTYRKRQNPDCHVRIVRVIRGGETVEITYVSSGLPDQT